MTPSTELQYRDRFTRDLIRLFSYACRISRFNPAQCIFWIRTYLRQKKKANTRRKAEAENLVVPPVLIFSATTHCNLRCKGCYAGSRTGIPAELTISRIQDLFHEASELGVGVVMIAGGEPLMKPEVLWAAGKHKDMIFPVFTNGMLLNSGSLSYFRHHRNLVPVLSAEGDRNRTDSRRGSGVYARLIQNMEQLHRSRQMYGLSFTLTRENYDEVTQPSLLHSYHDLGCRLFFMVDYVPQSEADMDHCLTREQKELLPARLELLRKRIPALFISLPGDEEKFGGCLAAGRGFAHISASGNLEPCPFAPYSDNNLRDKPLKEALRSPFMKTIRESHHLLGEVNGGCTLWENREWVDSQLITALARPA
ncbi:MAG: radical SAM protein [Bacteroidales bacterium]|nr:radical SAM protein [Bacteroidales bacterium]